uniref:Uncharacterized protein n=1 Tax=Anguilla anguilla TaxID=7936 RepID=A0A0E9U0Y6_ANGAN
MPTKGIQRQANADECAFSMYNQLPLEAEPLGS